MGKNAATFFRIYEHPVDIKVQLCACQLLPIRVYIGGLILIIIIIIIIIIQTL